MIVKNCTIKSFNKIQCSIQAQSLEAKQNHLTLALEKVDVVNLSLLVHEKSESQNKIDQNDRALI